jgi:hypothetical protein
MGAEMMKSKNTNKHMEDQTGKWQKKKAELQRFGWFTPCYSVPFYPAGV